MPNKGMAFQHYGMASEDNPFMPGPQKSPSCWYVYLIECRDGSLYTGIAVNVELRYAKHVAGTGARYTRAHPPLRLLGHRAYADRSEASRAEYRIKQLTPAQKRALCADWTANG